MTTVVKWLFRDNADPESPEVYRHQINPNSMSSPIRMNQTEPLLTGSDGQARAVRRSATSTEWSFGGVIRSQAQHDDLLAWSKRPGLIEIEDHLGRVFLAYMLGFDTREQRPTRRKDWRLEYEMTVLVVGGDW